MISAAGFKLSPFRKNKSMLQSVELYRYLANVQKKSLLHKLDRNLFFGSTMKSLPQIMT